MKKEMVYEGKAKKVYRTDDDRRYIIEYKDDATAFNGVKKGTIENKGIINNKMSAFMFEILEKSDIPTHFIELINDREMIVKDVKILPLEVIIRNISAGSLSKRLGLKEGIELNSPVLEFCYKNDELGDPMINEYHIDIMNLASKDQISLIKEYSFKINNIMLDFFKKRNIKLIDFKLEFGIHDGKVILADEISPDTCRLWDIDTNEKLDKDRFRRDLGSVEEAYNEVLNRLK